MKFKYLLFHNEIEKRNIISTISCAKTRSNEKHLRIFSSDIFLAKFVCFARYHNNMHSVSAEFAKSCTTNLITIKRKRYGYNENSLYLQRYGRRK